MKETDKLRWAVKASTRNRKNQYVGFANGNKEVFTDTTWHLLYDGKIVHSLSGNLGENSIRALADQYNREGKTIELSDTKLYMDMSAEDKLKLAAKTSPELFQAD